MNHSDLTRGGVGVHLRRLAIPASIGFFFNTMYNVVDTLYAGFISTDALAAMAIGFPVFFVIIALSSGISTGCSALISNALGSKKQTLAKRLASQSFSFGIITSFVLMIAGFVSAASLFRILGAEGAYLNQALEYIRVIFIGMPFFLLLHVLNSMLIARGG